MILILLLSIFSTAQLGQGAIEPGDANSIEASVQYCAADFFPADTLGVMEFSLEPWDRVGEETLAYSVLKQVTALQAFSDQAQHLFEQDYGDSGANIQLRSLLGGARFYFGFPSSLAQEESGIIGIDLTSQAFADQVESILNQMESDYRRVGDSFFILSFTGSGPRWSSGKRARFLEECIDKQRPNTPAADCLAFFPTWQGLRKELDHENRVFGFWIPTEAWREHGRQFVNFALEQQDDPEYLKEFTDIFIDALELEKIEGLAFTTDIEAPLFRDRFLMVGKSKIDDLYQPFSSDPKKTWQRLAQSSATALEITIGGGRQLCAL